MSGSFRCRTEWKEKLAIVSPDLLAEYTLKNLFSNISNLGLITKHSMPPYITVTCNIVTFQGNRSDLSDFLPHFADKFIIGWVKVRSRDPTTPRGINRKTGRHYNSVRDEIRCAGLTLTVTLKELRNRS
ncbi:hypothetical protein CDAR_58951 [Caerostris darwini]|uniref:Uncharacterized protein n=1 Tax=Caerostris darwini TaxID=1538125 RepID=A0AAV4X2Y7_9ARAC|nr:hypothetical protein CDAR_58951 [Caerostris darwini]